MNRIKSKALAILLAAIGSMTQSTTEAHAQTWEPVPLVTAASRAAGHRGGEGAQWPRAIAVDGSGDFLLFGSDVGGIYRSLDGGANWEPCSVGYTPRGTAGMAIDPNNSNRCLSVGANSVSVDFHGVYLSTDKAASWQQVFKANIGGGHDNREQLAFDPQTFDAQRRLTRVVYWSRIAEDKPNWGTPEVHPALYKSTDGGQTWREIPNSQSIGGSLLKVHSKKGIVYAANGSGFRRSTDGGLTFTQTLEGDCAGLDVSPSAPDSVWVCTKDGVWRSTDAGQSFTRLAGSESITNGDTLRNIKVSPVNANNMVIWREGANWQWVRFYSLDGGQSWQRASFDNTHAFLPYNVRQSLAVWHPRNGNVAWSTGGDWPTKSRDRGRTWTYSGDGYNVVLVGGKWNFNAQNPDLVFIGSQDYNGAVTTDAGRTWNYLNPSGNGWGGFCYGGYAASPQVLVVGNAGGWGSPRELKVSRDGGATWQGAKDAAGKPLVFSGPDVSYGDPGDANIIFASNLRSVDGGLTWAPMAGCDVVYTANPKGGRELFGSRRDREAKQSALLRSTDKGATWTTLAVLPGSINDIAFDATRGRIYVVSEDNLKVWDGKTWKTFSNMPRDQWGGNRISSVAVDPLNPDVVYATSNRDLFASNVSVLRSTDAGATWENLTLNTPLNGRNRDGGREAICVRVHPRTRYAYVSTSCYGIWKIGPPAPGAN